MPWSTVKWSGTKVISSDLVPPIAERARCVFHDVSLVYKGHTCSAIIDGELDRALRKAQKVAAKQQQPVVAKQPQPAAQD